MLDLYDELYKQNDIKHILTRHEQAAVHAAEGYARTSGKCGVVLVTSGPGATNTVTGIVNAYIDGYPLLVLTGQVEKDLINKNAFQEANICEITKTCSKKTFQIEDEKDIQNTIIEAYKIAMTGKKGPVVIDMPKNIFTRVCEYNPNQKPEIQNNEENNTDTINDIINMINGAERPLIVIGGGAEKSNCSDELSQILKDTDIPFVSTMMGLGSFEKTDNYFGMIGIFGDSSANEIFENSDIVLSLGARFNDRITCVLKNTDNKIIQIDINPEEISRNFVPKTGLVTDIKSFLFNIKNQIKNFKEWNINAQYLKKHNKQNEKKTNLTHSFEIIEKLNQYTKNKDVIFTSEVGQHQLWAVKNLDLNPDRKILVSGGTGTMGFGFPAAIGAAIANPQKDIVCIAGDGSFQMNLQELATCKDYNLNIKIIILNNGYFGMVRQLQEKKCSGRYSQTKISNPNYIDLARSYGIGASRALSTDQIDKVLSDAFNKKGPYIAEFMIEPMELI